MKNNGNLGYFEFKIRHLQSRMETMWNELITVVSIIVDMKEMMTMVMSCKLLITEQILLITYNRKKDEIKFFGTFRS